MSRAVREWSDGRSLRATQYRDGRNLSARLELHLRFGTNPQGFHRWVVAQLPPLAGLRVLEIGAGTGALWSGNRGELARIRSLALADLSSGMLRDARAALVAADAAVCFAAADAAALPFDDASFDLAIANHMLYHVPDRPRALAEIHRVLAPGGWFAAATNGSRHLEELEELLRVHGGGTAAAALAIEPFSLENGAAQLAAHFDEVRLLLYEDALAVTEVEPLLAYVRSMTLLDAGAAEALRAAVTHAIARDGAFAIRKHAGLFLARA